MNDANRKPSALVVSFGALGQRVVGGLTLEERWRRSLASHGATPVEVASASVIPEMLRSATGPVLLAFGDSVAEHLALEQFVETAGECGSGEAWILRRSSDSALFPILCLGADAARALGARSRLPLGSAEEVRSTLEELSVPLRTHTVPEGYFERVVDDAGGKRAQWRLIDRLRWRPGGLVAKYLNRPISTRISNLLVNTPVTPNQTTIFAFLLGAVGVVFIFLGGYERTVLGTVLLQLNSIIDGIDGELARTRHQVSEFGSYLDSVCDEILNTGTMVAVGYNLSHFVHPGATLYLALGLIAGTMNFVYALIHWHCRYRHGLGFYWWFEAYKPRREVQRSTSVWSYLKKLSMKESYLFLFMLGAIFGGMEIVLWPLAVGGLALIVLFTIHIPIKRARW